MPLDPSNSHTRQWIKAFVLAFILIALVFQFLAKPLKISGNEMEHSLQNENWVLIHKWKMGPRLPVTPISIPFTRFFWAGVTLPPVRLFYNPPERNDMVALNIPVENELPLDKKEVVVRRIIGLPGDTVRIYNKRVYINGRVMPRDSNLVYTFKVHFQPETEVEEILLQHRIFGHLEEDPNWIIFCSHKEALKLAAHPTITGLDEIIFQPGGREDIFPFHPDFDFNLDDFGPVIIPRSSDTIFKEDVNFPLYESAIYLEKQDTTLTDYYIFEKDHFFVLGDNRHLAEDSRHWGFVPESYIIGVVKPLF